MCGIHSSACGMAPEKQSPCSVGRSTVPILSGIEARSQQWVPQVIAAGVASTGGFEDPKILLKEWVGVEGLAGGVWPWKLASPELSEPEVKWEAGSRPGLWGPWGPEDWNEERPVLHKDKFSNNESWAWSSLKPNLTQDWYSASVVRQEFQAPFSFTVVETKQQKSTFPESRKQIRGNVNCN